MMFLPLLFVFSTYFVNSEPDLECYVPKIDPSDPCGKRWSFRLKDSPNCKEMFNRAELPGPDVCEDDLYISVFTLDKDENFVAEVDIKVVNDTLMGMFPEGTKYLQINEFTSSLDFPFKRKKVLAKEGPVSIPGIDSSFIMFEKSPPEELLRVRTDKNFEEPQRDLRLFNYGCVIKTITEKSAEFVFTTQVNNDGFETHMVDRQVNYFQAAMKDSKFPVKVTKINDQFKWCHVRVRACLDLYTNMFDLDGEAKFRFRNYKQTYRLLNAAGFVFKYVFERFGEGSSIIAKISKLDKGGVFTLNSDELYSNDDFIEKVLKSYEYAEGYRNYEIQKCINEHLTETEANNNLESKILLLFSHRPLTKTNINVEEMTQNGWKVVYIGVKDLPSDTNQNDEAERGKLKNFEKHIEYFSEPDIFIELDKKLNFLTALCKEGILKPWGLIVFVLMLLVFLLIFAGISFFRWTRNEKVSKDYPLTDEPQDCMDLSSMCVVDNTHIVIR